MSIQVQITGVSPHAEQYPVLSDDEIQVLAADIAENGLFDPITVTSDGVLLDGRNRLRACEIAGVEPRIDIYDGDESQIGAFVRSKNRRRHQPTGSRAMSEALSLSIDGKRSNGRWEYGTFNSTDLSNSMVARIRQCGEILDHAPALAQEVVDGHVALDAAYRKAQEVRDAERLMLERQERERLEEEEAREFVEANAPDLAAQVGDVFQSYAEAQAVWEKRNREEAAALAREKAEKAQREKEQRQARSDLYSGILRAVGTCAVYGKYEDIGKLMAEYNPAELNPTPLDRHLADLELAQRFIANLIAWRDQQ